MSTKIIAAQLATAAGVTTVITRSSSPGNVLKIVRYLQASKTSAGSSSPSPGQPTDPPSSSSSSGNQAEDALSRRSSSMASLAAALDTKDTAAAAAVVGEKPPLHTRFLPFDHPIRDRSFWLLHGLAPRGTVYIDQGAHAALADKAGLLPVGVVDVEGSFAQHEAVRIVVVPAGARGAAGAEQQGPGPNSNSNSNANAAPVEVGRALVNYAAPEIARIKGHRSSQIGTLLGYADSEYVAYRENISLFRGSGNDSNRGSRSATPTPPENGGAAAAGHEAGARDHKSHGAT